VEFGGARRAVLDGRGPRRDATRVLLGPLVVLGGFEEARETVGLELDVRENVADSPTSKS
jgi:hypothetical protein